ncbi:MAG: dynamin family protein, partial [Acetobacter sp.]|nr:dynamin family protein [Acetobacter sp.]
MQKNTTQENSSLEQRFIQTVIEWQHLVTTIQLLAFEVKDTLSTDFTEEQNYEMQARLKALEDAFAFLQEQASHPELTLATTGTTSSGKSTLANFLVGERILPSAVQEMSAGLVKIIHSDKRRLVVKRVDQITQEEKIIHTQENPTAKDINDHLESQMNAFRVEEESGKEVEAILFEITWPIRLAERKKELGLPEGTQVTILDLPGLKAV